MQYLCYSNIQLEDKKNSVANTAMVQFAKRTYALVEVAYPFQVKVESENFDIQSIGYDTFDG